MDTQSCNAGDTACANDGPVAPLGNPNAVAGTGRSALPFTGIEDVLFPILIGIIGLMGGVVMYRWAFVRERLTTIQNGEYQYRKMQPTVNGFLAASRAMGHVDPDVWSRQRIA